ncbi:hypothetical protein HWB91_gp55 [Bacillus phage vB_BboS-125]|uniref:Uncharacterized protein n=1 Tax=Bacillus phage vB_BboS-125 TaxID=2419618 RepID=A0A3G3BVX4_9CAUD|nr:hypothetical protein HWB91_gp55 [Bacillus phage vB_BboS-125]AYP68425.1 hypothetical protein BboS125_00056 [Bacillus phage vB_BboS-125]
MAKQLRAVIRKGGQEYQVNPQGVEGSLYDVHEFLIKVATGKDFIITENEILDLGTSDDYEAIKVWYEEVPDAVEVAPPEEKREYFEEEYTYIAEYLGNKLRIKGLAARYLDREYYLPMHINDQAALEALPGNKLKALLMAIVPANVAVIVPPAQLPDYAEAESYIRDLGDEYQKEVERHQEKQNKNAVAWEGWNEKE